MSVLYNKINDLCNKRGITGYRLCKDIGMSPNVMTELKMGRRDGLSAKNINKVAEYFNVSVGYLLGTENEKSPTDPKVDEANIDDFINGLTPAQMVEVMSKVANRLKERGLE